MKRIIFFILCLFTAVIILPAFVVLCGGKKPVQKPNQSQGPAVTVLIKDTGETVCFPIEEYLEGVVSAEMPASFHPEALKAQAVAARTFIYNKISSETPDTDHPKAHVCTDSTHCKAWISKEKMQNDMEPGWYENYYPKIYASVEETKGEIITYENEPIVAVFHSTSSGRTENAKDVWGGDIPYLQSVESEGDTASPKYASTAEFTKAEICETLGVTEAKVYGYERSEGGAVLTVNIGGYLFRGTDIRTYFGLKSANFEIEETENSFIFHVKGSGHGVGLSQYGANAMANNGSYYKEILSAYYTGVSFSKAW